MATTALEHEIVELEQEYWRAIRDKDDRAALTLTDDPCLVTGAQGAAYIGQEEFKQMLHSPMWELREFSLRDVNVRFLTDDVAIIGYTVEEQMIVEGKPLTLNAAEASTWVRRNGKWVCALHTESLLGDPFGRPSK